MIKSHSGQDDRSYRNVSVSLEMLDLPQRRGIDDSCISLAMYVLIFDLVALISNLQSSQDGPSWSMSSSFGFSNRSLSVLQMSLSITGRTSQQVRNTSRQESIGEVLVRVNISGRQRGSNPKQRRSSNALLVSVGNVMSDFRCTYSQTSDFERGHVIESHFTSPINSNYEKYQN